MKDHKCKCSHLRSEHNKKIFEHGDCKVCQCSEYVRHDMPTKFFTVLTLIEIGILGLVIVGLVIISVTSYFELIEAEYKFDQVLLNLLMMIILLIIVILASLLDNEIKCLRRYKARRNYNED